MLEDIILALYKGRRPSRYKGIGLRGGVILAIFWGVICGIGGTTGWDVYGSVFSALAGGFVGYRLERVGGAIAVAIFSLTYYSIAATSNFGVFGGVLFGFLLGLTIGQMTKE